MPPTHLRRWARAVRCRTPMPNLDNAYVHYWQERARRRGETADRIVSLGDDCPLPPVLRWPCGCLLVEGPCQTIHPARLPARPVDGPRPPDHRRPVRG